MAGGISFTGKLFGASVAAWAVGKVIESVVENRPAPPPQVDLDRLMPRPLQDALRRSASAQDGAGFTRILDANGCPSNPSMRYTLWRHFGGS